MKNTAELTQTKVDEKLVEIESISIRNFKGIKAFDITFKDQITEIRGANGTGKSTIFDAFTWCLFGKDHLDNKQFNIKPLDANNQTTDKVNNEVVVVLAVDGESETIKRVNEEIWTKPRGVNREVFSGNKTVYYWNNVPMSATEFSRKVNSIIDEDTFKLLTNPLHFNSLHWRKRREYLTSLIEEQELILDNEDGLAFILREQLQRKSVKELQDEISAERSRLKKELEKIPIRIDEAERSRPELADIQVLKKSKEELEGKIEAIEKLNTSVQKRVDELMKRNQSVHSQINNLRSEVESIKMDASFASMKAEGEYKEKYSDLQWQVDKAKRAVQDVSDDMKRLTNNIDAYQHDINAVAKKWTEAQKSEFYISSDDVVCGECGQDLPHGETIKKEMEERFNEKRARDLARYEQEGNQLRLKKTELQEKLEKLAPKLNEAQEVLRKAEAERDSLEKPNVSKDISEADQAKINELQKQIEKLNGSLETIETEDHSAELRELRSEMSEVNHLISLHQRDKDISARIYELQDQEEELVEKLNKQDGLEFTLQSAIKDQMNRVETAVNKLFSYVSFKMFDTQINGGENEICDTLINGVPFSDANTASKINAGLDIINVFGKHLGVSAPIFLDNKESVTNIIETDCQMVYLVVDENAKKLEIA